MAEPAKTLDDTVCIGQIRTAHGVRGLVLVASFTADPDDLFAYGPVSDKSGKRRFTLVRAGEAQGDFLVRIDGVTTREAAKALASTLLYVPRAALPAPEDEDEFYYADLIGLIVEDEQGSVVGRVADVADHGGGTVIEVHPPGSGPRGAIFWPFTLAVFPTVDIAGGRLIVRPPAEIAVREEDVPEEGAPDGAAGDAGT